MTLLAYRSRYYTKRRILVSDSFNRPDAALNGSRADTGQLWTAHADYQIVGNLLDGGQTDAVFASIESGKVDVAVESDLVTYDVAGNERRPGLVARYVDDNNYYGTRLSAASGNVVTFKVVAGVQTNLATYTVTITSGTVYRVRLVVKGSAITTILDRVPLGTVSDTALQTGTKVGYRQGISLLPLVATEMADAFLCTVA